ncbi:MAG TPA: FAD-dependent oxidoreductase [Caulobacteraceae bacterium]|nr:FAD-dependent oxidoreductase [Caulobacteraceae bacterium]
MPQVSNTDVLICGAGAAGLTLAIELARRGVGFRLVDKLAQPFPGSRGKGTQPRSQEVFEDLGILDRIVSVVGLSAPPVREYAADGTFTQVQRAGTEKPTPAEPYRATIISPQFVTEPAMRERLAELGRHAEFGRELKGFEQDGEGVTARIAGPGGGETVRARYLVGTDGGRSFVRSALKIGFPGESLGVRFFVADTFLEGLDSDVWHHFNLFGSDQWLVVAPLRGTGIFQLQGVVPLEGDVDLSAEALQEMVVKRTGRTDILIRSVRWASAYATSARLADHFQVGRVFLAGDAAHTHSATGAQGLNTSVQDAYNLGWKLAAVVGGAPEALLVTYEEERRPIAASVLGLSTRLLREATTRRGREVHQLDLGYFESSLALEKPGRGEGLRAGARAPDAPVRGAAGQPTRLFNLFQGPHWTLLGYETVGRSPIAARPGLRIHVVGPGGDIIDDGGHMRDAYGLSPGDWLLVRPDGYVGAIVSGAEVSALDPYLASVGVPA